MLTGESKPVSKKPDDDMIGGAINGEGSVAVEVRATGADSFLSQVIGLVREAQEQVKDAEPGESSSCLAHRCRPNRWGERPPTIVQSIPPRSCSRAWRVSLQRRLAPRYPLAVVRADAIASASSLVAATRIHRPTRN